jgi:phenylpropionate dioxygenase-like ring-hydroxylating dioxygenase large terminal subunit
MAHAPSADRFPAYPVSWYLFGTSRELGDRPVSRELLGRRLVAYRARGGQPVLMSAACSHLGADLGRGEVVGDNIRCPFHHWEYGPDGHCCRIPLGGSIPLTARQACFPVFERHGFVFFFNAPEPLFALPFFPGARPDDFVAARPFATTLHCPWYMVGANAFDLQHFHAAHDRRLAADPVVDCPAPFARRAGARFTVSGNSLQDRVTRLFAGPEVYMSITDWCGNLMFATAEFRRTTSYGMVVTEPLDAGRVQVRVIVFVPRGASFADRLLDPVRREVRRFFIKRFLSSDADRLNGAVYNPAGLIEWDRDLADYFTWLADVAHGRPCSSALVHKGRQALVNGEPSRDS